MLRGIDPVLSPDLSHALRAMGHGDKAGIRYFDTAPHYGRVLSAGTQQAEADGFIDPLPNDARYDYSGEGIRAFFAQSCERLGRGEIDIVFVHDLGVYTHGVKGASHRKDFLDSGYYAQCELKREGRVKAIGLGVNEAQICLDVMDHGALDVIFLAGRLTLLDRSADEVLAPRCIAKWTSSVLGGIFNSGILATGTTPGATYDYAPASKAVMTQVDSLGAKARSCNMSLPKAAIQFAQTHPAAASVLMGMANPSSLRRNLDLAQRPVPSDFSKVFQ
ncbi:MAG: aldo/keto reductase [Yoonia sp.]|uniref:aldo/keto reductase n=1 Tax=Yoonia sp. TaxID=2212373 RepID=UPI003EFA99FE